MILKCWTLNMAREINILSILSSRTVNLQINERLISISLLPYFRECLIPYSKYVFELLTDFIANKLLTQITHILLTIRYVSR